uniref:Uncharacterized protein n=1 Tax=Arundo donax TaxID=35708 RepID=A0A0A9S7X2_ARUDO
MTDLAHSITFSGSPSLAPPTACSYPSDSMPSSFFNAPAWLSVTLRRHLLTLRPSCPQPPVLQLLIRPRTEALLAHSSTSR